MSDATLQHHLEDEQLLEKFQHPESKHYAFNLLVRKYQQRVYWHVRKMVIDHQDADDLTQDIFIKIWNGLPKFQGQSSLFTWIYRIAINECLNFLNKKKRRFLLPIYKVEKELNEKIETSADFSGDEIQKKLHKAILTLPEKQRLVFNMKYFEEMEYQQMSDILGTSVGALKASYHHAVKKIEAHLSQED